MNSSIDLKFEKKCLDDVKNQILQITDGKKGNIFLFGSRAKGTFRRGSDIDLVNFNHVRENFRKVAMEKVKLWKKL